MRSSARAPWKFAWPLSVTALVPERPVFQLTRLPPRSNVTSRSFSSWPKKAMMPWFMPQAAVLTSSPAAKS